MPEDLACASRDVGVEEYLSLRIVSPVDAGFEPAITRCDAVRLTASGRVPPVASWVSSRPSSPPVKRAESDPPVAGR